MTAPRKIKAGPITLASGLILGGAALLLYNFGAIPSLAWLWKISPLLLVGIGMEYFLKRLLNHDPETEVRFSIASLLLIIVLILVGGMIYNAGVVGDAGSFSRVARSALYEKLGLAAPGGQGWGSTGSGQSAWKD